MFFERGMKPTIFKIYIELSNESTLNRKFTCRDIKFSKFGVQDLKELYMESG